MRKKKLAGTAKYLHQIYTVEGGPEKHDDKQQAKGVLKITSLLLIGELIRKLGDKIENMEIKALKPPDDKEEK